VLAGLEDGETIATHGAFKLRDGMRALVRELAPRAAGQGAAE